MQPRVLGEIKIQLLEGGVVQCAVTGVPGGVVQVLGLLEFAKQEMHAGFKQKAAEGPGITVAPPGMSVLRNGG